MSFDWKSVIGTVAPILGAAVGGPFGGIAGKMIQETLGVDSEEAVEQELMNNPDALFKIKELESVFKTKMRELGIQEEQLHAQDRDSARKMAMDKGIIFQAFLTLLFMVGYFSLIYFFFFGDAPELNDWQRGQVGILIGVLTSAIPQQLAFWFGSSKGSKDKTVALARGKFANEPK